MTDTTQGDQSSILPFAEYAPDVSDFQRATIATLQNVFPRADGYGPAPSLNPTTAALPAACRGKFFARNSDGSITTFAAISNQIFKLNNTDFSWTPVSKVTALTSISNGSPAVFTLNSHGRSNGEKIVLSTTGTLPTPLTVGTPYFIINSATNTFNVSLTSGGPAINTTGAGSGTHSMTYVYTAVTTGDQWQFAQFNNFVFAVQINTAPQVFDLTSSSAFADLGGSPPQARYIAIVNRFVVLSGLGSSTPYRIQWSGLNATTTWTSGVSQSDFQDLPDGGIVRGVAGGESGLVMQDGSIRRMTYAPGSSVIFVFERISEAQGIFAPLSLTRAGDRVFYIGNDGFKMILPGGYPTPIGREKVDRFFLGDVDQTALQVIIGAPDPRATRWYIAYKSQAGQANLFDKILVYDWTLDRWSLLVITGEYLSTLASPGLTLENLDSISSSLDALTISLDDFATNPLAQFAGVNSSHIVGFFSGANLEAILTTAEQGAGNQRLMVTGFRPDTDAPTVYGSVSYRESLQAATNYTAEAAINAQGFIPLRKSTRYARGKIRIPAGTNWTFAGGIEPDVSMDGQT